MNTLRLGVAGLGTVGAEVVRLVEARRDLLAARCGRGVAVTAVSARDRDRDRGIDLSGYAWHDDPRALAGDDDVDVVVELIGGEEGPARDLVRAALAAGKPVVTAHKALIARHGAQLADAAEAAGVALALEAAVAGGIPVLKALRESLAGNSFGRVYGILNGTCNYILTVMEESGRDFADVLAEAQALGYAEADPSFDIDGVDAAHKLAILASLAFGSRIDFDGVHIEGIRHVDAEDIRFAERLGYRIKLLGIARRTDHGIEQRVHPCMVRRDTPIARVDGVFNAVVAEGDAVDRVVMEGRGAGAGPTASAVLGDICDIARGIAVPVFSQAAGSLAPARTADMADHVGPYYVRLTVRDQPGVIADVSAILRDERISIESMLQQGRDPGEPVPVVLITHDALEAALRRAMAKIAALEASLAPPRMVRIETL